MVATKVVSRGVLRRDLEFCLTSGIATWQGVRQAIAKLKHGEKAAGPAHARGKGSEGLPKAYGL